MTLEPTQFATEAQLWNAIVRQFGQALPLVAGQVNLAEAEAPQTPAGASFAIGLPPSAAFTLVVQDYPFPRLTGVEITLDEILSLPAILSEGLLLAALDTLRTALPSGLATQLALPSKPGAILTHETWISAEIDLGGGALARCLIGGRRQDFVQVLSRLFPAAAGLAPRLPTGLLDGLSVDGAVALGEMTLPVAAVGGLEAGDVLLAEIRPDRRIFRVGKHDIAIETDQNQPAEPGPLQGWTVKEIRMTAEPSETETEALSLDDVPLTLRFVTEDRRISLAELQGLAAGALLPFEPAPLKAGLPLRIQANGVTVGEGHLVQIDDRFAVRIARMAPRKS